jgi:hypothetical protein
MSSLEITDAYTVLVVEYAEEIIEARWRGAHYINYYYKGEEFACAWQNDVVRDEETLRAFVLSNLPYHLEIESESETHEESQADDILEEE